MAVGASGSNQTAGMLKHRNYVIHLVSRVKYESPAYPLSNAPTLEKIRWELDEKRARQCGTSKLLFFIYF
jgi:hypothetical protein